MRLGGRDATTPPTPTLLATRLTFDVASFATNSGNEDPCHRFPRPAEWLKGFGRGRAPRDTGLTAEDAILVSIRVTQLSFGYADHAMIDVLDEPSTTKSTVYLGKGGGLVVPDEPSPVPFLPLHPPKYHPKRNTRAAVQIGIRQETHHHHPSQTRSTHHRHE